MLSARLLGPNNLKIVEMSKPNPGIGQALCKVVRTGICGTDYAIYSGEFSFVKNGMVKFPMTLGHEWSGVVEQVGVGVTNVKPGDRVVGDTAVSCGTCYECVIGSYGKCKDLHPVGTINAIDGAYAEYILMPARHLFHLPDNVSFENGAMVEPSAIALYAVHASELQIGDTVLVLGSGPIGIAAAKLAKLSGAAKVIIAARKDYKLNKAVELGLDDAINTTHISLEAGIKQQFGSWGVDKVIEASGSVDLLKESLKFVNNGGVIASVAFYEKLINGFDIDRFVFGEVKIKGVACTVGMYHRVLRLMSCGMFDLSSLITGRYKLEQAGQALEDMRLKGDTRIKSMLEISN
jgi:L-iditol 2-dehydrogenase